MKKISLYARKRMHKPEPDKLAPLRLLDIARPYEPGEMVEEHVATKAAYIRLRDGEVIQQVRPGSMRAYGLPSRGIKA